MREFLNSLNEELLIELNKEVGCSGLNYGRVGAVLSSIPYIEDDLEAAASVVMSLIKDHTFYDGNKRTAILFYLTVCEMFGITPKPDDYLFEFVVEAAALPKYSHETAKHKLF